MHDKQQPLHTVVHFFLLTFDSNALNGILDVALMLVC